MTKLPNYTVSDTIERVLLICKSHLDIGFTDYSAAVKQAYLTEFIPKAIALGRRIRAEKTPENFVWTTGSWLIYEYWRQAKGAALAEFEAAVRDGIVAWHALPFTSHTELSDPSLYAAGFKMARELDAHFGKNTIAAKMTDVPGHTGGLVPLLARNGVKFLHLGVNPASPPPAVPELCRWQRDGEEVLLMYAAGDYGANVAFPQYKTMVIFAHGGDNSAPMGLGMLRHLFRQTRLEYPRATVAMGTLDDLAALLLPHAAEFPVFSGEIGDSWIHGLGTDPAKVAQFRALSRFRQEQLLRQPQLDAAALADFERNLLLVGEHTWGMDIKTHLGDDVHWTRPELDAARRELPNFAKVEASWQEQRAYLDAAVAALPAPLRRAARRELSNLQPRPLCFTQPQSRPPHLVTAHFQATFNRRGELVGLTDTAGGKLWSRAGKPLAMVHYRQYNRREVDRWLGEYCRLSDATRAAWALWDMGKMMLPETIPACQCRGESAEYEVVTDRDGITVKARVTMPRDVVAATGCPARLELEYRFPNATPTMELTVQWFDKAANRVPEALFLSFGTAFGSGDRWRMNKLGSAVDPLEVVSGGGRALHGVNADGALTIAGQRGTLRVDSPDAALLLPGACELWRFTDRMPDLDRGFHFCLYNNQWGTNFPMWYGEDGRFRFRLTFTN